MKTLQQPFVQVESTYKKTFGGDQARLPYRFLKKSGCGIISAANVLLYKREKAKLTEAEYIDFAKYLWKYYLPVVPGFGMNGLTLMAGMNAYFLKHRLPYRACWKISAKKLPKRIDRMLDNDLPVILSVGPNFPNFLGKQSLNFYKRTGENGYRAMTNTRAHFVTVTGRDEKWLQISSWGKEYYIDLKEYQDYVKKYSSSLVSNLLYIYKKSDVLPARRKSTVKLEK